MKLLNLAITSSRELMKQSMSSEIIFNGGDGAIRLYNYDDASNCIANTVYTTGWQYVTVVQDGGTCSFYRNGVDIGASDSSISTTFPNNLAPYLGSRVRDK